MCASRSKEAKAKEVFEMPSSRAEDRLSPTQEALGHDTSQVHILKGEIKMQECGV